MSALDALFVYLTGMLCFGGWCAWEWEQLTIDEREGFALDLATNDPLVIGIGIVLSLLFWPVTLFFSLFGDDS